MAEYIARLEDWLTSKKGFTAFAVCLLLYVFFGSFYLGNWLDADLWAHLASMGAFSRELLNPQNPFIVPHAQTYLFTPFHLFWGAFASLTRIHPFYLIPLIGGLNLLLFLIACHYLAKFIVMEGKYALCLALVLLFLWLKPIHWSGFYNFGMLPLAASYPYWFAFSVALIVISWYGEAVLGNVFDLLFNVMLIAIVFLCHPISGSFLFLSLMVKSLTLYELSFFRRLRLLFPLVLAALFTLLWPYYSVLQAVTAVSGQNNLGGTLFDNYQLFYQGIVFTIITTPLGLVYLFNSLKSRRIDFTTLSFLLFLAIYLGNYFVFHSRLLARFVVFMIFYLHLATVLAIKTEENSKRKALLIIVFVILMLVCAPLQIMNSFKKTGVFWDLKFRSEIGYHSSVRYFKRMRAFSLFVDPSDVVLADLEKSWSLPGIIGNKIVGVLHPFPFLADHNERVFAVGSFFSGDVSIANKVKILKKYDVDYLLLTKSDAALFKEMQERLRLTSEDEENVLFKVDKEAVRK